MRQKKAFRKYEKGFNQKWLKDEKITKSSRELAEFYANLLSYLFFNGDDSDELMIRFMPIIALEECLKKKFILNLTFFCNYDRRILRDQGFNLTSFDQKFGNPKCVVAIPLRFLSEWFNTYSWIKLFVSGTLESALIFSVPKVGIILRKHKAYENSFKLEAQGANKDEIYRQQKKYFESTDFYSKKFLKNRGEMLEAWIPYAIDLKNFTAIKK